MLEKPDDSSSPTSGEFTKKLVKYGGVNSIRARNKWVVEGSAMRVLNRSQGMARKGTENTLIDWINSTPGHCEVVPGAVPSQVGPQQK
jgi:hypothetical protein